jgi:uncharacterized delta-60 repeat protein
VRTALALAITVLLGTASADAAAIRCPDGWFLVDGPPLFGSSEPFEGPDAVMIRDGRAGVRSGCPSRSVGRRPGGNRTVRLRWNEGDCGGTRQRWRLEARMSRTCDVLAGTFVHRGPGGVTERRRFEARRVDAPDGAPDLTFGVGGQAFLPFAVDLEPAALAVTADDGLFLAGFLDSGGAAVARLDPTGTLAPSFDGDGVVRLVSPPASWRFVFAQPDGGVVAAGTGIGRWVAARYHADGSLDTTFGTNGVFVTEPELPDAILHAATAHPEGGWVLAGFVRGCVADTFAGCAQLLRLDADGHPVSSFGTNGVARTPPLRPDIFGASVAWTAVTVEPDGTILAGGTASECPDQPFPGTQCLVLAQFAPDGAPDPAFAPDGVAVPISPFTAVPGVPSTITRSADGGLSVIGELHDFYYASVTHGVARFSALGVLVDATELPPFADVASVGGRRMAIVGSLGFAEASLLRFLDDWSLDTDYGDGGRVGFGEIARLRAMAVHADGRISMTATFPGSVFRRLP